MQKKLIIIEDNDRKEYSPPKIEVVEVMIEKGFGEGTYSQGDSEII